MSFFGSILGDLGVGQQAGYGFDQQQKDFIKLQFKYGLLLKQKLAAGTISQAQYDSNFWLTTQQLEAPYNGWWDEFKTAIQSEDLNWLAKQVGETVDQLTAYMGTALYNAAKKAANIILTAADKTGEGLLAAMLKHWSGWLVGGVVVYAVYIGFKKGYIQKFASHEVSKLIP